MLEHDSTPDGGSPPAGDRREHLTAAAIAAVGWVQARRASWSAEADGAAAAKAAAPKSPSRPKAAPKPKPVQTAPVAPPMFQATTAELPIEIEPDGPSLADRMETGARSLGAPAAKWSLRLAAVAAVLVVLGGGAWAVRATWSKFTAPSKTGTAVFESDPPGSQVVVDAMLMGVTPFTAELRAGRHVVGFRYKNATRTLEFEVAGGQSVVQRIDWGRKTAATGSMRVDSDTAGARVLVDGKERGVTPLTIDDLSLGAHTVTVDSPGKGSLQRTVTVTGDRVADVNVSLYPGFLRLFSPIDLQITEGKNVIRLDDRNQVLLPAGPHDLRLENRALGFREIRHVELKPGETTSVSIIPPPSTISVTATLPSDVLIDGERAGLTPLANHAINLGTRDVVVKSESGGERRFTLTVTVNPVRLDVDFSRPQR